MGGISEMASILFWENQELKTHTHTPFAMSKGDEASQALLGIDGSGSQFAVSGQISSRPPRRLVTQKTGGEK